MRESERVYQMNNHDKPKIPVGISSCLMGQAVRFDGGHKRSRYCLEVLEQYFDFKPFCPEVAIGLPIPREPIRLVGSPSAPRAVGVKNPQHDVTQPLKDYANDIIRSHPELCGYVLMRRSPSCGMERVKVYAEHGLPSPDGTGIYTAELMAQHSALPVEEEGRLNDAVLRENFITRVFVYHRWQQDVMPDPSLHKIIQFHTQHKLQLMAHHANGYRQMGRYLAQQAPHLPLTQVCKEYLVSLMGYLSHKATRSSHYNVLLHVLGHLKKLLDGETKRDLIQSIEDYRSEKVHLVVPLALLKHYLKRHGNDYILSQAYLDPHPHELGLRNYI